MAAPVRRAAFPADVPVRLEPAERFTHGLRLDSYQLGKLRLRHGAVEGQHFHGNDPGVRQSDSTQFFIPGMLNEARRRGQ